MQRLYQVNNPLVVNHALADTQLFYVETIVSKAIHSESSKNMEYKYGADN